MNSALDLLKKSEELSKKNDFPIHLLEIYRVEISILERQENWKSVSDKYREYNELSEKLVAIEVRNKVDDMMYSNDIHKKELPFFCCVDFLFSFKTVNFFLISKRRLF